MSSSRKASFIAYAKQWTVLGRDARMMLIYTVIRFLGFSVRSLFGNLYLLSLGYEQDFIGLLMSISAFPAIFLSLPAGFMVQRLGSRKSTIISGLAGAVAMTMIALSTSRSMLLVSYFINGCVLALNSVASFPLVAECAEPENQTMVFSAQHSVRTLTTFVGSLIGGFMPGSFALLLTVDPESAVAYRATLLASIAFMLIALIPLFILQDRPRIVSTRTSSTRQVWHLLPKWLKLVANNVLISVGAGFFVPFFNVFFKEAVGVSDEALGTIFALAALLTGLTTLLAPYFSKRWGVERSVVILQLASIPVMLAMGFIRWAPAVVVAHWVRMAIVRVASPLSWSVMMEQVPQEDRGVLNGLTMTLTKVITTIVPYISGMIQVRYGFAPLFVIGAVIYVIASATMYWFYIREPAAAAAA